MPHLAPEALANRLRNKYWLLRRDAILVLGMLGEAGAAHAQAVTDALRDRDVDVREAAAEFVTAHLMADSELCPAVAEMLCEGEEAHHRALAARILTAVVRGADVAHSVAALQAAEAVDASFAADLRKGAAAASDGDEKCSATQVLLF